MTCPTYSIKYQWKAGKKYYLAMAKDVKVGYVKLERVVHMKDSFDLSAYGADGFPIEKIFYLAELRVYEPYRLCGIGKALMKDVIRWANISKNIITLDALPLSDNIQQPRLVAFYQGLGFRSPPNRRADHCSMSYHDRPRPNK